MKKLTKLFEVDPYEELSEKGYNWTGFHYACHFNNCEALEFLITLSYRKYQNLYSQILNMPTKEGYTPLMVCCIYKSNEALELLLKYGGVNLLLKDNNQKTAVDLGKKYGNSKCESVINKALAENDYNEMIQPNYTNLNNLPQLECCLEFTQTAEQDITDIDKVQFQELLLKGQLLPCIICLSNLGHIKYTNCCGQPLHQHCCNNQLQSSTDKSCPVCKSQNCQLVCVIRHPERALTLQN